MTTAADDRTVEEAFEASLAGRPVPGEAAGLAAFTSAVRSTATQPGRPNAALAELLSTGLLTDQSSPSTRTAPAAGPLPSRRTRSRTRRRFTVIVPALIAKFLSAGAVAQGPQETFDNLVGTNETAEPAEDITDTGGDDLAGEEKLADPTVVTPVEGSDESEEGETDVELTDAAAAEAWATNGPADRSQEEFKKWLAEGAENGWVNGQAVSKWAHERNDAAKKAREAAREAERHADEDEADENETEVEDQDEDTDEHESEVESSD